MSEETSNFRNQQSSDKQFFSFQSADKAQITNSLRNSSPFSKLGSQGEMQRINDDSQQEKFDQPF